MRDAFLKQLEELHKMLAEMGLLCEKMIDGTYEALTHMDREQAAKILQDDANVDLKERDIESKCLKLLLEQQPVASDLRKISSALKMITDLERIGDQAGDIAEIIKTADLLEPVKATRLGEMAKAVASMVRESVESFANEDLKKTKEVIAYDDVIDDMFSQVKKELADGILNGEATQEQILDILMIAKYYERIGEEVHPGTVIGEDGGTLSQGQKQLLCIARVMLCLPPMLILDEATSSIDTRTEMKVQNAFQTMMEGRTSFIVAHRLSTIQNADVILVMRDGQIIEQGTHQELLAKKGFYEQLYQSQFAH